VENTANPPPLLNNRHQHPLVVGLTGGIGSGKSTVAAIFHSFGTPVIDADLLARELVEPGEPALDEIKKVFGESSITGDGHLNRTFLRQRIFKNRDEKHKLEEILHPQIRNRIRTWIAAVESPYCIAVIPLLLKSGQTDLVDRVLVIDTPENEQRKRVAARDSLSHNVIMAIMETQADRGTRLAAADDIIKNNSDIASLHARVLALHNHYLKISRADESR